MYINIGGNLASCSDLLKNQFARSSTYRMVEAFEKTDNTKNPKSVAIQMHINCLKVKNQLYVHT
jgi:hypothetical protein